MCCGVLLCCYTSLRTMSIVKMSRFSVTLICSFQHRHYQTMFNTPPLTHPSSPSPTHTPSHPFNCQCIINYSTKTIRHHHILSHTLPFTHTHTPSHASGVNRRGRRDIFGGASRVSRGLRYQGSRIHLAWSGRGYR